LNNNFSGLLRKAKDSGNVPDYNQLVDKAYTGDHFLVKKPSQAYSSDNPKYNAPFEAIPLDRSNPAFNEDAIHKYFMQSDYWGDEVAREAMLNVLQINVILFLKRQTNGIVHYGIEGSFNRSVNDNWNKYLFLYNNGDHYELMTFIDYFPASGVAKAQVKNEQKISIFERNSAPPIYIIFLLFFVNYNNIDNDNEKKHKDNYSFLSDWMRAIDDGYNNVINGIGAGNIDQVFIENLADLIPYPDKYRLLRDYIESQIEEKEQRQQNQGRINQRQQNQGRINQRQKNRNTGTPLRRSERSSRFKGNVSGQAGGQITPSYYPSSYPYQGYPSQYSRPMYPYQGYPSQYSRPMYANQMYKQEDQYDPSKLAYTITIGLELYPGTNVTKEQIESVKCNSRWESVRQAWAEFSGKPYVIVPNYQTILPNSNEYNKTQRNNPPVTRNPYQNTRRYGGKKNKTFHNKHNLRNKKNKTIKLV
jgi:hypothetical protein